jgi:hypothetical protein
MMALRDVMPSGTMGAMTLCPVMVRDGRNDRVGDICESENAQNQAGYGCTNNPAHILLFPASSAGKTYSMPYGPSIDLRSLERLPSVTGRF